MPRPKLSDFSDYEPRIDSHKPLPITNLPVNAITEANDPTLEIRTLIEQLQKTARDARTDLQKVEDERDDLTRQMQLSLAKIEELRANERELRSQFVEVSSILRERDLALEQVERQTRAASEAEAKLATAARERNDAQRQREDAVRQRDDAMRRIEALNRTVAQSGSHSAEWQKQLQAIRQARDGAHALNVELTTRLARSQDEVAEFEYQRDAMKKAQKQAESEATEYRRQLDAVTADRDATTRQVGQLTLELDEQRKKLLDLAEQKTAVLQADNEHTAALAEARVQVVSLTQERDSARTRAQDYATELEAIRAQFQTFRDEESKAASTELAATHEKLATFEALSRESRHEAANLRQQLTAVTDQLASLQQMAEQTRTSGESAQAQIDAVSREREAALTSLNAAQKQIDYIISDRDSLREQAKETTEKLDGEIQSLRAEVSALRSAGSSASAMEEDLAEAEKRLEKQRLESIDLATQLYSTQREVRELSASLAEARLQVKTAMNAARAVRPSPERTIEFNDVAAEPVAESAAEIVFADAMPLPITAEEPLNERAAKGALGAMRHCFQSFTKNPTDLSLLNELYCHVLSFSERARTSNLVALHRLCHSLAELTQGLYQVPEQINPSTLRTVNQTIDFLGSLMRERGLVHLKDPAKSQIYAVDDDEDNCQCIQMAMEEQMMRTTVSVDTSVALMELASSRFDLIFLDVSMPGMDGFELCEHIRDLALHAETPVVFLTGLATIENRVQSTLSGGNDFIAKPFNVRELSVKALTLIMKTQLGSG